ncbi:MAG: CYTH domain-containing protein [Bacilli bacterium]|nr:CYTH domain-containing protein [Bacilli bacterium]
MQKIEQEVKVLEINVEKIKKQLIEIGAIFKGEKNQKIYVYDIPSLYYRFLEIRELLNIDSPIFISTNLKKLKTLMLEFNDLVSEKELEKIKQRINVINIIDIHQLPIVKVREILSDSMLEKQFREFIINPNKWVRLRESNGKVELTTKHILEKQEYKFQKVLENEIDVSSLEETNLILESIGLSRRSYQEKIRYSYKYKDAEIEIDLWPLLKPYLEIECDNEETIDEIINKLNLESHEVVSINTEQLYKRINIDVHSLSELKF